MKWWSHLKKKSWILLVIGIVLVGGVAGYYLLNWQKEQETPVIAAGEAQEMRGKASPAAQVASNEQSRLDHSINDERAGVGDQPIEKSGVGDQSIEKPAFEDPPVKIKRSAGGDRSVKIEWSADKDHTVNARLADFEETSTTFSYRNIFRDPFAEYRRLPVASKLPGKPGETPEVSKRVESGRVEPRKEEPSAKQVEIITPQTLRANLPFKLRGIVGSQKKWLTIIEDGGVARLYRPGELIKEYKIVEIAEDSLLLSYRSIKFKLELRSGSGGS